jgi:mRNA interferase MazF
VVVASAGEVVPVPFPFSDLSQSKLRPAVCLADVGRSDWVLCQITSSPYGDPSAVPLDATDFSTGGLLVPRREAETKRQRPMINIHLFIYVFT